MYRAVDLIEVRAWGATVGGVSVDPGLGYYVFEYDPKWQSRGIELAPLTMPVAQPVHVFPLLPEATFKRLPAMLADALPDDFGNALIDAYLAREGVAKAAITALDRLAYMSNRGMGALEFRPARGPRRTKATAVEISQLVTGSNMPGGAHHVVDAGVLAQAVVLGQRVVAHADQLGRFQVGQASPTHQFRGLDEFGVVVGALGQHFQHILGGEHGEQVGFRVAVQCRQENLPPRLDQAGASRDDTGRVRYVLEHF